MNRPLSAPGYTPREETNSTISSDSTRTIEAVFAAIEERAELAQTENRGHKLPLEDLPRPLQLKPFISAKPLEEDEFEVCKEGISLNTV